MKIKLLAFLFILSFSQISAQSFELKNNIEIIVKHDGQQSLVHTVEPKQTIYNISRLYNLPIKQLLTYNKLTSKDLIYQGNKIYIPLNHKIFTNKIQPNNKNVNLKPVVYIIKPKDSFYAVTKRYFNINGEVLIKNNNLKTKDLTIGQGLVIGWIALKGNYSEWNEKSNKNKVKENNITTSTNSKPNNTKTDDIVNTIPINKVDTIPNSKDSSIVDNKENNSGTKTNDSHPFLEKENELVDDENVLEPQKKYFSETGVAIWNKLGTDRVNSFVLHPTAKINSVIELFNPLTNRTAYAKVIAHIPDNTYEADIAILISPKVAERLGALDERFKIKMTYYK